MKRAHLYSLVGALLLGFLVRFPGIFWGYNFPTEWYGHHVDEYTHGVNAEILINPLIPPRWPPQPYPKGLAAHVAVPVLAMRLFQGHLLVTAGGQLEEPPALIRLIVAGRVVSVVYGTATILILFLLAKRLFRDLRVALCGMWIFALGGLHVSQSHYFVADVPALFWTLLGLYLLASELEAPEKKRGHYLVWAAFCFGVAFGLKLAVSALLSLAVIAVWEKPRFLRAAYSVVFFAFGFVVVNFGSFSPFDLYKTFVRGVSDPSRITPWARAFLYSIELPSILSLPVLLLAIGGCYFLARKLGAAPDPTRRRVVLLVVILPLSVDALLVVFKLDPFPRHVIPFIPWVALVAAWSLLQLGDKLRSRGLHPGFVVVPLFIYLAVFVYDGEKVFFREPRNDAARWILQNVPRGTPIGWGGHGIRGYPLVEFPEKGRPPVVVCEMFRVNPYVSGVGWKNSFPTDYRTIFNAWSPARVQTFQSLFKGTSEYREVARFKESYFMPEYTVPERLIGDRSRNYVTEIVIFRKAGDSAQDVAP